MSFFISIFVMNKKDKDMKVYKFSVTVEEFKADKGFIAGLQDEVADEANQLLLTHKINKETTKLHRQILVDLIGELNQELTKVGLSFGDLRFEGNSNHYEKSMAIMPINGWSYVLGIVGHNNPSENFTDSIYTTLTGGYYLVIKRNSSPYYTANQLHDVSRVKDIKEIFEYMRNEIKVHIAK